MIPAPGIIGGMQVKFNFAQVNTEIFKVHNSKLLHHFTVHINADDLAFSQLFYKLNIIRKNSIYFTGP